MSDESIIAQVAALSIGETVCRCKLISASAFTPDSVKTARRAMLRTFSTVKARAEERAPGQRYAIHTTAGFTAHYDVIVAATIVRER